MSSLIIVKPLPIAALGSGDGYSGATVQRLLTPDPKEALHAAAVPTSGSNIVIITIDFGIVTTIDTALLGFTNLPSGSGFLAYLYSTNSVYGGGVQQASANPMDSALTNPRRHILLQCAAPVASRYWSIYLFNNSGAPSDIDIGVLAMGLAFAPTWGQEMGAGRGIDDTSNVDRTFGGGFEIDQGAIVGGYSWTLGDLSASEIRQLYAIARDCGVSRSILVVEDVTPEAGWNEKVHWGIFDKLDFYERNNPANWKWALKVRDWG